MPPDAPESDMRVLSLQIDHLNESVGAMQEAMCRMADAVNKLAVVEERQSQAAEGISKLDDRLGKIEDRLRTLEIAEPMQTQATDWVYRALWAVAAAAAAFIAAKAGLI